MRGSARESCPRVSLWHVVSNNASKIDGSRQRERWARGAVLIKRRCREETWREEVWGENKEGRTQSVTGTPRLEPTRLNCEGHLFTVGPPPHAGLNQIYHWDNTVSTPPSNNKPTVCYIQIIPPSSQPHGCFCQRCPTSSLTSRLACQKTGQVTTKLQFCKLFYVCSQCKFSQIQT